MSDTYTRSYPKYYAKILNDPDICQANKDVFTKCLEKISRRSKRRQRIQELDEPCYKTLHGYLSRMVTVNRWFKNKPWTNLTADNIEDMFDKVETGIITKKNGLPYKDSVSYYERVMLGLPFKLVKKDELAKEVIGDSFKVLVIQFV